MVDFTQPPTLHDGYVTLRKHALSDADAVFERSLDPTTAEWTTIPQPYERSMAVDFLTQMINDPGTLLSWAIDVDGSMAGSIDVRFFDESATHGEIGYALAPQRRGQGVAPRALRMVLQHSFGALGTQAIRWRAFAGNDASWKVAQKCGFPQYREIPYLIVQRGRMRDGWQSVLVREAWAGAPDQRPTPGA